MRLRRLEIQNFRGIRHLDWRHIGTVTALIGPGDTGKSTVLDAIERILSPRWNLPFDDSDFWNLATESPIVIRGTITEFPEEFYRDTQFGLALQNFDSKTGVATPITDDSEGESHAIVIELRVQANLEPAWDVIDGEGNRHMMRARNREALGMLRLGSYLDRHLGWGRGSVLSRLTQRGNSTNAVLADAIRSARSNIETDSLKQLSDAASKIGNEGKNLGVSLKGELNPHLDVSSISLTTSAFVLHDGAVPVRRAGLGTRRLLAVAIQRESTTNKGLTLVDEFEHGLEPHRIHRLLRVLTGKSAEKDAGMPGQIVLTTHSTDVLSGLVPDEVQVVKCSNEGNMTITSVPTALEHILLRVPGALLARKAIVVEGDTEAGLCIAFDQKWADETGGMSFAYRGVSVVHGGGSTQPAETAKNLCALGYEIALLVDSDANAKTSRAAGATVLAWPGHVSVEERLANDLPLEAIREMSQMAAMSTRAKSVRSVRDCIADVSKVERAEMGDEPRNWVDAMDEKVFRSALGTVAKKKGWFKNRILGHALGSLVAEHWDDLSDSGTGEILRGIRSFVHDV